MNKNHDAKGRFASGSSGGKSSGGHVRRNKRPPEPPIIDSMDALNLEAHQGGANPFVAATKKHTGDWVEALGPPPSEYRKKGKGVLKRGGSGRGFQTAKLSWGGEPWK